jgi:hypothetical protein
MTHKSIKRISCFLITRNSVIYDLLTFIMRSNTVTMSDMCQVYTQFENKDYGAVDACCSDATVFKNI